jgi:hypothetical protein
MNLAEIFSEARSGTIAHINKKRFTAVTHLRYFLLLLVLDILIF